MDNFPLIAWGWHQIPSDGVNEKLKRFLGTKKFVPSYKFYTGRHNSQELFSNVRVVFNEIFDRETVLTVYVGPCLYGFVIYLI